MLLLREVLFFHAKQRDWVGDLCRVGRKTLTQSTICDILLSC